MNYSMNHFVAIVVPPYSTLAVKSWHCQWHIQLEALYQCIIFLVDRVWCMSKHNF